MNGVTGRTRHLHGVTLVELGVVIGIIALLAAILTPAIMSGLEKANQGNCLSNQQQLARSILTHVQDHDNVLPLPSEWVAATGLAPNSEIFDCPSTKRVGTAQSPDYGFNAFLFESDYQGGRTPLPMERVTEPASVELTTDLKLPTEASSGNWTRDEFQNPFPESYTVPGYGWMAGANRHGDGVIASFIDGHAAILTGREMGVSGKTPYNIPPGYGRVYIDFGKLRDAAIARDMMQTFIAFAATWQKPGGAFNTGSRTWEITNGQLLTSGNGQTYDANCIIPGVSQYAVYSVEFECTPGSKVLSGLPNDFYGFAPVDAVTRQHEKLRDGYHSLLFLDTVNNEVQAGMLKAASDLTIYSGYSKNTWIDLDSANRGRVQALPPGSLSFKLQSVITYRDGTLVPFPADPTNKYGWCIKVNPSVAPYGTTGRQMAQNVDFTLSNGAGPFMSYNGPYIQQGYAGSFWGRILLKVMGGTVNISKIHYAPSL